VLLGNAQPQPAAVRVSVNAAKLRNPLASVKKAEIIVAGKTAALKPAKLSGTGHNVTIPADDVVLVHLTN
jgi:homoserine dehydrogenase